MRLRAPVTWEDLHEGILGEFAERSADVFLSGEVLAQLHERAALRGEHRRAYQARPDQRVRAAVAQQARYAARRRARIAARSPCLACGREITREARRPARGGGRIPVHCSPQCAHRHANRMYAARRRQ